MSVLEEALLLSCEIKSDSLECDNEFKFSSSFENRMDKLIDKMRDNKYHRLTKRAVRMLAVAAVVLSFSATAFAFPFARQYIITEFRDHDSYKVLDSHDKKFVDDIYIGYIPEGFTEKSFSDGGGLSIVAEYVNNNSWFVIQKSVLDTEINYDSQNNEIIKHNNIDYHYHASGESNGIIFNDGNYVFNVAGNISKEELKKIAFELK
ncbi:MAG: DUF4367 domain-containing protein [Acetobacter sp.]|nr:DUF4367 domain-containing protein [Bacteroides sp.]MCM1341977.1 DUF4367 domain-containing protein [Acetobacter sp.]MCM1434226.1 DUF4367 domain-containing protein [Clostridiales bacterium]